MVLSNLLILLCLPSFSGKHPCLPGCTYDENERCYLFRRPKMYVQKRKYIPKDDYTFETITIYEDVMKQDAIDIPWESLAAYTVPWDPQGLHVKGNINQPYPIVLESRKELVSPPAKDIPLKHAFMPPEEVETNKKRKRRKKYKKYSKNEKSVFSYIIYGWPVYCAIIFELIAKLLTQTVKPSIKRRYLTEVNESMTE